MDAPVPIVAGISYKTYKKLEDSYELGDDFLKAYTWVHLDQRDTERLIDGEMQIVETLPHIMYSSENKFE